MLYLTNFKILDRLRNIVLTNEMFKINLVETYKKKVNKISCKISPTVSDFEVGNIFTE